MSTEDEMRKEVARVMALENPTPADYGRIQALGEQRAREWAAPFLRKIQKLKWKHEGRCPHCGGEI